MIEAGFFLLLGAVLGAALTFFVLSSRHSSSRTQTDDLIRGLEPVIGSAALKALAQATGEAQKLADVRSKSDREHVAKDLESKKELIEQRLVQMNAELEKVSRLVQTLEKDREEKFGQLTSHLQNAGEQTRQLLQTTQTLKEALASSKARGQWGERMAEDVLRLAGFVENTNYLKQKSIAGVGSMPDFTFLMPKNRRLNMDVKFPLDNYMKFLNASGEAEKTAFKSDFLRDVRAKIKEVTTRDYVNPEQNTLDYVLLFVPNEQIYGFIHEQDQAILDEGLNKRVIFCSPVTLFAVLAVIRQAVDNFSLEQTSNEILTLLSKFKKQWGMFLEKLENVGKKLDAAQKEYQDLSTTRRKQLERPLDEIDAIRRQKGLAGDGPDSPDDASAIDVEPARETR